MLNIGDSIGIIACSNGKSKVDRPLIEALKEKLKHQFGIQTIEATTLYQQSNSLFSGTKYERRDALMNLYLNPKVKMIFDLSGGDVANELLPLLDFKMIQKANTPFVGYSDLTVLINAILHKTGINGFNYQLLNLVKKDATLQERYFSEVFMENKSIELDLTWGTTEMISPNETMIGGNIRCLLKLAGTRFLPSAKNNWLLLEARSGDIATISSYFAQLEQIGYLEDCKGILLGEFTELNEKQQIKALKKLILSYASKYHFSIAQTQEIGHSSMSKPVLIGKGSKAL
ncbi:LD-carboxypeptidase [Carnobacterium divergens]|uniref:LD-carboxypeptidase n=1 Tax=Carnobacterium divergens TaxID=2748 RepID=UPI0028920F7B|nr:LD-carboxypeptidase [Carnobacterium divergens]MDT2010792.1 LD-carboxypeptidase [Carnobacterium divergens]